jgi:hypothetical protein
MTEHGAFWDDYWQEAWDETKERSPEFEPEDYYRSGRSSKLWPDKEDPKWWAENGPKFVKSWQQWRKHSGLLIAEVPNDEGELIPAIELECWAYGYTTPDGLESQPELIVRSFIDRVFVDEQENWYIVDLKTGSMTQPWPLQLALNALGLRQQYPDMFDPRKGYGGFWKARSGGIVGGPQDGWFPLGIYTDEWMWELVSKARAIRDQQLFIPNPNNLCKSACGVSQFCVAMGGSLPLSISSGYGATMTQDISPKESE